MIPVETYYLPNTSPLYNAGSRLVADAGLYHYTTRIDQVKEGQEPSGHNVNIGLHYVATTNYWGVLPYDSDGDGIADYIEDSNGNGVWDQGSETDWLHNYSTIGPDGVNYVADKDSPIYDDTDLDGDGMVGRIERALGTKPLIPDNPFIGAQVMTGDEPDIITFREPITYSTISTLGRLRVCMNGHEAYLQSNHAANDGSSLLLWNAAYELPGAQIVQLRFDLKGTGFPGTRNFAVGAPCLFNSGTISQFFVNSAEFDNENGAYLFASLPQNSADYTIKLYDAANADPNAPPIKTIPSSTTSGTIEETWDLTLSDGITKFAGTSIRAVFDVNLHNPDRSGQDTQVINYATIPVTDGNFDVAFMFHDDAMTEPHYGPQWIHTENVVDILTQPQNPGWYDSTFNQYDCNGCIPYPGYIPDRQTALALLNDLAQPVTKNLYLTAHQAGGQLSDGKISAYLDFGEVASALGVTWDPVAGISVSHPFRFVFINGCESASWTEAFGIFPVAAAKFLQKIPRGPQAFVGWRDPVAFPDDASMWDDDFPYKGFGSMIEGFYAEWMSGDPLKECIAHASDRSEYLWPLPVPSNSDIYPWPNEIGSLTSPLVVVGNLGITRGGLAPGF